MKRLTIAVDVDITVVPSDDYWWFWLECASDGNVKHNKYDTDRWGSRIEYDLSKYFELPQDLNPMAFWKSRCLYDNMQPYDDVVSVLRNLSEKHDIVFVSSIKGDHAKSKYAFLQRHFPFNKGVLFTKEKQHVRADVIVDDRNEFLLPCHGKMLTVRMKTPYKQDIKYAPDHEIRNMCELTEVLEGISAA